MDDPGVAGGVERRRDVGGDASCFGGRQLALAHQAGAESFAWHLVHYVVQQPFAGAGSVHRNDVGMAQPGDGAGFGEEPAREGLVAGQFRMDDLDGDGAIQRHVGPLEHHAHAATSQLPLNAVLDAECPGQALEQVVGFVGHGYS